MSVGALLISGSKRLKAAAQFRIVTGHGCFVMPVKQKARTLAEAGRDQARLAAEGDAYRNTTLAEAEADSNVTILNGTQGINEILTGLVGQGLSVLETLKKSAAVTANGASPASVTQDAGEHHRPF